MSPSNMSSISGPTRPRAPEISGRDVPISATILTILEVVPTVPLVTMFISPGKRDGRLSVIRIDPMPDNIGISSKSPSHSDQLLFSVSILNAIDPRLLAMFNAVVLL